MVSAPQATVDLQRHIFFLLLMYLSKLRILEPASHSLYTIAVIYRRCRNTYINKKIETFSLRERTQAWEHGQSEIERGAGRAGDL